MSSRVTVAGVLAGLLASATLPGLVHAQDAPAQESQGDAERGRQLAYTCYGCHGISNYKNVYPTYSVPKLQGQHPAYLALALAGYKSGERGHSTMHAQAATMNEQDMKDIGVFLAGEALKPAEQPPGKGIGQLPKKAEQLCVSCHGADGVGISGEIPSLAGQHADYLERTLLDYKNGGRRNPVMAGFVTDLSATEIRELAKYYARQKPSLSTAEHANWFAQKK